jgi:hypothetical protein
VRIYLAADIHGSPAATEMIREDLAAHRPDVFVAAGDVTHFGPVEYAQELFSGLSVPTLAVPGNCDPPELVAVLNELGINLHGKKTNIGGHTFVGIGGSNPTPFRTLFELSEEEILATLRRTMERGAILVSHPPPHGYVDVVHSGAHVGSTSVRTILEEFAPPLVLCGHIHEARGIAMHHATTIVNPGPAREGHRALIELDRTTTVRLL